MNEMVAGQDILPMDLVQRAVTSGADVVVLEKLMGLQERYEHNKARKAFDAAISAFKLDAPQIVKDQLVDFTTNRGRTRYRHADLAAIAAAIDKPLAKVGLSYRWRTLSTSPTEVTVICIVSHRDGYSEENSLSSGPETSGNKNNIQALGSACTYLERYTLMAALGLTASEDDDGQAAGDNGQSSGDAYAARWQKLIADATSHEDLAIKWNADIPLRKDIEWRGATLANLKDAVTRRIEELKLNAKAADLATQRLDAENA
jgi:hypothetical protein